MKTKELSKPKDSTRLLLDRIISWEKDLNEYPSLESILREQFIIYEREEGAGFINGMFKKREQLEAEHRELLKAVDLLKRTRYPFPEQPTLQEEIELFLNSLKTK